MTARRIGPDLDFSRHYSESGIQQTLPQLLACHQFDFPVKRSVYLTGLRRVLSTSVRDG